MRDPRALTVGTHRAPLQYISGVIDIGNQRHVEPCSELTFHCFWRALRGSDEGFFRIENTITAGYLAAHPRLTGVVLESPDLLEAAGHLAEWSFEQVTMSKAP